MKLSKENPPICASYPSGFILELSFMVRVRTCVLSSFKRFSVINGFLSNPGSSKKYIFSLNFDGSKATVQPGSSKSLM